MTIESSGHPLGLNGPCSGGSSARNQIGAEALKTATGRLCMNCSLLRLIAGRCGSGGVIHFSDFYGKTYAPPSSVTYNTPGTFSWVVPAGVTSISVVAVGSGGNGYSQQVYSVGRLNQGGGGGGLGWKNNISVTPGQSHTVQVGYINYNCGTSYFCSTSVVYGGSGGHPAGGTYGGSGGGCGGSGMNYMCTMGGYGYAGGGGAGYTSKGGTWCGSTYGAFSSSGGGAAGANCYLGGGGTWIDGQGASGSTYGAGGSGGARAGGGGRNPNGGIYGGGAGSCGSGAQGAVRIIWPGNTRGFPSTCAAAP